METNLKTYNGYLKQCTRFAKREHYVHEFTEYKNDIRKTGDTLKDIINTKKSKSDVPPYFVEHGDKISGSKTIADKFNEYFTKIGPELASSVDMSRKIPFKWLSKIPMPAIISVSIHRPRYDWKKYWWFKTLIQRRLR